MKDKKIDIRLQDPELPKALHDARRNHGGMTVPEGFFQSFEHDINALIDAQPQAQLPQPEVRVGQGRRWIGAVAAAILVIVIVGLGLQFSQVEAPQPKGLPNVEGFAELDMESTDSDVAEELLVSASDYEIFEMYCDL